MEEALCRTRVVSAEEALDLGRKLAGDGASKRKGFFTDTTICIGCKACEVACKQWNQLPDDGFNFSGMSYDNTVSLGASTWRHVAFIERPWRFRIRTRGVSRGSFRPTCAGTARAGCLETYPTGAIVCTKFDSVYVQPDICNGCGYCVINCPFGVIDQRQDDGRAWKCTLCYDRLKDDMKPGSLERPRTVRKAVGFLAGKRAGAFV